MTWILIASWARDKWREIAIVIFAIGSILGINSCNRANGIQAKLDECEVRRSKLTQAQSVTASGRTETRIIIKYKEVSGTAQPCPDIDLTAFTLGSIGAQQEQSMTVTPQACPPCPKIALYGLWSGLGYLDTPALENGLYGALGASYGPWLVEFNAARGPRYGGGLRYKAFSW